jgi:outer membrane receptor for ferrienterochelin and colicin
MYQNIDKAVVSGLDVLQGVQFSSGFLGNIGISMVRAINSGTNKQLYNIAPVSINASLAYTFSLWQIRHNIEVFDKFIGRREFEPVESIRYIDQPFQILRFTYSCSLPYNIYASFGVDNVLDKVMPGSLGNTSPGRRFFVSLRYSFKKY